MTTLSINMFLWGACTMGGFVAAVFFFRFYRGTKDSFFLMFGLAFLMLAVDRVAIAFIAGRSGEESQFVYLLRLAAFVLIVVAIISKNRRSRPPKSSHAK
jgi:hypothetical protein